MRQIGCFIAFIRQCNPPISRQLITAPVEKIKNRTLTVSTGQSSLGNSSGMIAKRIWRSNSQAEKKQKFSNPPTISTSKLKLIGTFEALRSLPANKQLKRSLVDLVNLLGNSFPLSLSDDHHCIGQARNSAMYWIHSLRSVIAHPKFFGVGVLQLSSLASFCSFLTVLLYSKRASFLKRMCKGVPLLDSRMFEQKF